MQVRVLGCSGGIGPGLRTTTVLLDDDVLIDAGTGVGDLSLSEMQQLQHVFLTHAHLDHVCGVAFAADNLLGLIREPITVHGIPPTIRAVRSHIFNWEIWPDFSNLPKFENPSIVFSTTRVGALHELGRGRRLQSFEVRHSVPATGYAVTSESGAVFAFTGDTGSHLPMWRFLSELPRLDYLMIDVAFGDEQEELGVVARHFTPGRLAADLANLGHRPEILLTHHKPGSEERIREQCADVLSDWPIRHLQTGDLFQI